MKKMKLDRINRAILENLQSNARISNLELAEKINLSPSACLQRTKALEDAGYIRAYMASIDIDAICINVMAYVMFSLRDHAGLDKRVMLVGQLNKFQLWDEDAWNAVADADLAAIKRPGALPDELRDLIL